MLYKTLCPISHLGSRVERGEVLDLTDDQAFNYAQDVQLVVEQPEVAPDVVEDIPLTDMTTEQLKEKATALGLKTSGSKADLVERITLYVPAEVAPDVMEELTN